MGRIKFRKRIPKPHLDLPPIIEPGTFQFAIVQGKSEGLHQVERRSRRQTKSSDVPRIRRDLRFDQDDVKEAGVMECWSNGSVN